MSDTTTDTEQSQELAVMAPALRERFEMFFLQVPEADSEEAVMRIVEAIFAAEEATELDAPWSGEGMKAYLGHLIHVQGIRRLPSDYTTGPGWYLGCECVVDSTGEKVFVTTGSVAIMAQLVTAFVKGMLPIGAVPRQAERKSRNGYYPMHLEIWRRER